MMWKGLLGTTCLEEAGTTTTRLTSYIYTSVCSEGSPNMTILFRPLFALLYFISLLWRAFQLYSC